MRSSESKREEYARKFFLGEMLTGCVCVCVFVCLCVCVCVCVCVCCMCVHVWKGRLTQKDCDVG